VNEASRRVPEGCHGNRAMVIKKGFRSECHYSVKSAVTITFTGTTIEWRGPSPFVFLPVPNDISAELVSLGSSVSYGWGCIRAVCECGDVRWETSLMPRQGIYLVPIKVAVQRRCNIDVDVKMTVTISIQTRA